MSLFATAAIIVEVIFWIDLLSAAAAFVAALVMGAIEDISDHKRIVALRIARGISPPSPQWEHASRMRRLRSH